MGKSFVKPFCEIVPFTNEVIASSICGCDIGGIDIGGCNSNICTSINTYCDCQTNTIDDTKENCIKPGS